MKIYEKDIGTWKVEFFYSPFFEMICSLHVLTRPEHHLTRLEWAKGVKARLGEGLHGSLVDIGIHFHEWCTVMDFCKVSESVNDLNLLAALDFIAGMDMETFIRVLLGNCIERDRIKVWLRKRKAEEPSSLTKEQAKIFSDPEGFRRKLISLLKEYYYLLFERELLFLEPLLIRILKKQGALLENKGILEYVKTIHNRIEIAADAFYFHKYTKFIVPFDSIEKINFTVSSFVDPHLLIGLEAPKELQLTVRASMEEAADVVPKDLFKTMKALGDETRLKILKTLYMRRSSTQSLARDIGVTEACISKHLKILHEAGVLYKEREGNYIYYLLDRMTLDRIPMDLYQYMDG